MHTLLTPAQQRAARNITAAGFDGVVSDEIHLVDHRRTFEVGRSVPTHYFPCKDIKLQADGALTVREAMHIVSRSEISRFDTPMLAELYKRKRCYPSSCTTDGMIMIIRHQCTEAHGHGCIVDGTPSLVASGYRVVKVCRQRGHAFLLVAAQEKQPSCMGHRR